MRSGDINAYDEWQVTLDDGVEKVFSVDVSTDDVIAPNTRAKIISRLMTAINDEGTYSASVNGLTLVVSHLSETDFTADYVAYTPFSLNTNSPVTMSLAVKLIAAPSSAMLPPS